MLNSFRQSLFLAVRLAPILRATKTRQITHMAYETRKTDPVVPEREMRDAQPARTREFPPAALQHPTPQASEMVLSILRNNAPRGLTTREIFNEAITIWPPGPSLPPRNTPRAHRSSGGRIIQPMPEPLNHPLRSIKYIKKVLANLESQRIIRLAFGPVDKAKLTAAERARLTDKAGYLRAELKAFRWTLQSTGPQTNN
ncbi:hypothetical protein B0H12DRAFT_1065970 [Mycena haematopus]|nr:hypothetical protein B0H12DRAFT_1065970 [Mycena haematopus]